MRDGNSNSGMGGNAIGGVAIGLTALGGTWLVLNYLKKKDSGKETKEAQEKSLGYTVSQQKTKERIAQIEQNAWRTGINGYAKNVSVNVITEAKDAIRAMYTVTTYRGNNKYEKKTKSNIKAGDFINSVFSVPISSLATFAKVYTIYTGASVLDDASMLDNVNYAKIKTLFKVSRDKFPNTWKK